MSLGCFFIWGRLKKKMNFKCKKFQTQFFIYRWVLMEKVVKYKSAKLFWHIQLLFWLRNRLNFFLHMQTYFPIHKWFHIEKKLSAIKLYNFLRSTRLLFWLFFILDYMKTNRTYYLSLYLFIEMARNLFPWTTANKVISNKKFRSIY